MPQYRWNILLKLELNSNQSILYIIVFNERILNKNIFSMNFKKTMKTVYLIKKKQKIYSLQCLSCKGIFELGKSLLKLNLKFYAKCDFTKNTH